MKNKLSLELKPFQETLHQGMCGAASLRIVLDYYGLEKSEKELAQLCGVSGKLGTDGALIGKAAESLGFKVLIKNDSNFEDIESWLERGVPLIVDWFSRGRSDYSDSEVADGHYSVVAGLDGEYIYLQDPETGGEHKLRRDDFMRVWFDFAGECINPQELIIRQLIAIFR